MVINSSGKPKFEPPPQDVQRQKILDELAKLDYSGLLLAFMYARGYEMGGENVTKEWSNALTNTQILETAYRRGYEDCEKDIKNNQTRDFAHKTLRDRKN